MPAHATGCSASARTTTPLTDPSTTFVLGHPSQARMRQRAGRGKDPPMRGYSRAASSLRLEAGVLHDLLRGRPILLDLFGELLRRIDRRHQAAGGEMPLAEGGVVDDARRPPWRACRRSASVCRPARTARTSCARASRRSRSRPASARSGKFGDLMLLTMTSGVIVPARIWPMTLPSPNERDRGRSAQHRVDRLAAAFERHAHPVGALLLLERLHVERERRQRRSDSSGCRPSPSTMRSARRSS